MLKRGLEKARPLAGALRAARGGQKISFALRRDFGKEVKATQKTTSVNIGDPTALYKQTGIMLLNSLKPDGLVELEYDPIKPLTWYCCGPTVYSHSHLGHARCYIVFDTIRRLLRDKYGLPVKYVMNITDIDDKIINSAQEQQQNYSELARFWEADFFRLMQLLNVQMPDNVTRVSEYIPEIIDYVKKIECNGFAYKAADGSVYFDVEAFKSAGFVYCQLNPAAHNDSRRGDEGAGNVKKNTSDFVLWKMSKTGEPSWPSPWGKGRPGWHIECSAMVQASLSDQEQLSIHSGGWDLKFPHHDNEIAQGEAHDCQSGWVKYFIHVAPLNIKGLKMSKSLKNFVTIDEALKTLSGRQLRLLILLHKYNSVMNLDTEGSYVMAIEKDKLIANFLANLRSVKNTSRNRASLKLSSREALLLDQIYETGRAFDRAIQKNFDTQEALEAIFSLIKKYYQYELIALEGPGVSTGLVESLEHFIARSLAHLGLEYTPKSSDHEIQVARVLDEMAAFRAKVIEAVKSPEPRRAVFEVTDKLRDVVLPSLGAKVEDGRVGWKHIDDSQALAAPAKASSDTFTDGKTSESIFQDKKYLKFNIGTIGADGIPLLDTAGKPFPPKVLERFKRDLVRSKLD